MQDDIARSGSNVREADRSGRKDLRHCGLRSCLRSRPRGAKTLVYLASSPDVADLSGGYFFKCRASAPAPQAEDDNAAKRLWRESAKLASIE
jgi:hypothetical protein